MRRRRKAPHKNTVRLARLLENGICILSMEGFEIFKGMPAFEKRIKTSTAPPRFIITHYPLASLYGTPGFKEAFIHCDRVGDFIFEAKYQNGSGSVDEKCPYLWECFSASTVPNWIVWFDR